MIFERHVKSSFYWSSRREAALIRARRRLLDKAPLYRAEADEKLCTVDEQRARLETTFDINQMRERSNIAALWRRSRRLFYALPSGEREAIRRLWNGNKWVPKRAEYFADTLFRWITLGHRPNRFQVVKYGLGDLDYGYSSLGDGTVSMNRIKPLARAGGNAQLALFN